MDIRTAANTARAQTCSSQSATENITANISREACTGVDHNAGTQAGAAQKPKLIVPSFFGNVCIDAIDAVPQDLDRHLFAAASAPGLVGISQLSRGCHAAVKTYLCESESAGGQGNAVRRSRFNATQARQSQLNKSGQLARNVATNLRQACGADEQFFNHLQKREFEFVTRYMAADNNHILHLPLESFLPRHWPALVQALTANGQWRELTLMFPAMGTSQFANEAASAVAAIAPSQHASSRVHLVLGATMSERDVDALLSLLRASPQCRALTFANKAQNPAALQKLLEGLPQTGIDTLHFDHAVCSGHEEIYQAIFGNAKLQHLKLAQAPKDEPGVTSLASGIGQNNSLKSLTLYQSNISDAGAIRLAQALASHPLLERLEYHNRSLGHDGWLAIGQALANNAGIAEIIVSECRVGDGSMAALLKQLETRHNLVQLRLTGLFMKQELIASIDRIIANNAMLCRFDGGTFIDVELTQVFVACLSKANGPLTLEVSALPACRDVLVQAAIENPLLAIEETWH